MRRFTGPVILVLAGTLLPGVAAAETTGYPDAGDVEHEVNRIALAPDGDVWFTEVTPSADRIGRLDPATGTITRFTDPGMTAVTDLTVGTDGTVWFAGFSAGLGSLDADSGAVTWHPYVTGEADPVSTYSLTIGPDGTIWFTDADAAGIGWVDPDTGAVDFAADPLVTIALSPDVVVAGDGTLWFIVPSAFGAPLRRFDPTTETFSSVSDPEDLLDTPASLGVDTAGDVWFGDIGSEGIGRVDVATATVDLVHTNHAIADAGSGSTPLVVRPADDGTIWFAGDRAIGRMEPVFGMAWSRLFVDAQTHSSDWVLNPRDLTPAPAGGFWVAGTDTVAHHVLTCGGREVTVDRGIVQAPTEGDDVILATAGDDHFSGLGGDDVICGGLGDDQLQGGAGRDRIFGGLGRDAMESNGGGGLMNGGAGPDLLRSGWGPDVLQGGTGQDLLTAGPGPDRLDGGPHELDTCVGGAGRDRLTRCEHGDPTRS